MRTALKKDSIYRKTLLSKALSVIDLAIKIASTLDSTHFSFQLPPFLYQ